MNKEDQMQHRTYFHKAFLIIKDEKQYFIDFPR
jgi:hypothetical protein